MKQQFSIRRRNYVPVITPEIEYIVEHKNIGYKSNFISTKLSMKPSTVSYILRRYTLKDKNNKYIMHNK